MKRTYENTLREIKGKIYYYNSKSKKIKNSWKEIDGNRYYFCSDGHAATGFKTIRKKKYCFTSKGVMRTGWYKKGSKTYYFDAKTGVMTVGWKTISGNRYHFNNTGVMTKNKWINSKYLDQNGAYDPDKKKPLSQLEKKLRSTIKGYSGTWTIYVKNLNTNKSICINNKQIYAASLIKLYAMSAADEKIEQGKIKESSIKGTIRSMISVSSNNSGLRTGSGSNMTTVKDCGNLLESIYRGICVSKSASKKCSSI